MMPLKNSSIVDDAKVDNIFYMIPEILMHHSVYLDLLNKVWRYWDTTLSTVGNIILDSVCIQFIFCGTAVLIIRIFYYDVFVINIY